MIWISNSIFSYWKIWLKSLFLSCTIVENRVTRMPNFDIFHTFCELFKLNKLKLRYMCIFPIWLFAFHSDEFLLIQLVFLLVHSLFEFWTSVKILILLAWEKMDSKKIMKLIHKNLQNSGDYWPAPITMKIIQHWILGLSFHKKKKKNICSAVYYRLELAAAVVSVDRTLCVRHIDYVFFIHSKASHFFF